MIKMNFQNKYDAFKQCLFSYWLNSNAAKSEQLAHCRVFIAPKNMKCFNRSSSLLYLPTFNLAPAGLGRACKCFMTYTRNAKQIM